MRRQQRNVKCLNYNNFVYNIFLLSDNALGDLQSSRRIKYIGRITNYYDYGLAIDTYGSGAQGKQYREKKKTRN